MPTFNVRFRVSGTIEHTIEAENEEEAFAKANEYMTTDEGREYSESMNDLHEVDDADFTIAEFFPVIRDGKKIKTTYVRDTDQRITEEEYGARHGLKEPSPDAS